MQYWRCLLSVLFAIAASSPLAFAQRGARVAPQNLAELSRQSAVIVRGHVLTAVSERHPQFQNLNTIVVTMKVDAALKGDPGRTYTFRQFVWDPRDARDVGGYRKGQELLMLMNAANENGLTSPVGLGQGRFRVTRDAQGRGRAENELGNAGLFRGMENRAEQHAGLSAQARSAVRAGAGKSIDLPVLEEIIRAHVRPQ